VIQFQLDHASGVATYLQLVQQVRDALRPGLLEPGDRLPTFVIRSLPGIDPAAQRRFLAAYDRRITVEREGADLANISGQAILRFLQDRR